MTRLHLRTTLRSGIAVAALATIVALPSTATAQFSGLYFFGDSFTDVGNAAALAAANALPNPTPPPYAPGRFSNGPIWSELFAAKLLLPNAATGAWLAGGSNYAVGGATTGLTGALGSATGMLSQAQLFAAQHPGGVAANGLFVLWGGGNDITDAVMLASPAARQAAIVQAVTNITTFAGFLNSTFGATNFLIPSLPNLGVAPLYNGDAASAAIATGLTLTFNQLLGASVSQIDALPGVNAYGLSLNNLLSNIQFDAATGGTRFGITNLSTPCFLLPNPTVSCNNALFVDSRHPTQQVHKLFADAAYDRVVNGRDIALLPEPSAFLLMGAGLAALAIAVRRRRAA